MKYPTKALAVVLGLFCSSASAETLQLSPFNAYGSTDPYAAPYGDGQHLNDQPQVQDSKGTWFTCDPSGWCVSPTNPKP
jgi:hypothetical protein